MITNQSIHAKLKTVKRVGSNRNWKKTTKSKRKVSVNLPSSPQPGPSHINLMSSMSNEDSANESESQIPDEDKCCVCKRFYAQSRESYEVYFTQQAWCDICGHWVHLRYCTPIRVVQKETLFTCPCCSSHAC